MIRRGVAAVFLAAVMMTMPLTTARAAGEQGSIRLDMGPELAGKTAVLYLVLDTGAGEMELAGQGLRKELSEAGTAMFTGLAEGMYLVSVEDILAVPVTLPEKDGSWMAQIAPGLVYITPETGQPIEPLMWTVGMGLSALGIGIWYAAWLRRKKQ